MGFSISEHPATVWKTFPQNAGFTPWGWNRPILR